MAPPNEQRILLSQATAGMILSRPVALPNKVVLCARGLELSDIMIIRLMSRGIKRVYVQGNPLPGIGHDAFEESIRKLHERFSRVTHVPLMLSLAQLVEKAIVRRL
jgi:hypothetical protein